MHRQVIQIKIRRYNGTRKDVIQTNHKTYKTITILCKNKNKIFKKNDDRNRLNSVSEYA